jgi:hypothetical protein
MKSPAPLLLLALAASGQTPVATRAPAGPAAVVSREVFPNHSILFRLRPPQAKEVAVGDSFWLQDSPTRNPSMIIRAAPRWSDYYSR